VHNTHFLFVQLTPPSYIANLLLLQLAATLLAPAVTDADLDRKEQVHSTALIPQMRNDLGAPPLFDKRPLG
jgi:hypothetical protein